MKTEEQIRAALDALHKDGRLLISSGQMTPTREFGLAQTVGTLLWVVGDGDAGMEGYIARSKGRFEEMLGMAAHTKYGWIFATNKAFHPDEPVFLIRATDKLAVKIVLEYAERCVVAGCDPKHVEAAFAHMRLIREWQEAHPELVKTPD